MNKYEIDTGEAMRIAQRDILLRIEKGEDPERVRIHWKKAIDEIVNTKLEGGSGIAFVDATPGSDEA
ncbi:Uncharacterised protein [Rhodococcus gordoniae]|uniref:Uncharacterized protein n=1 Tax=Rhodococcus gordoniae TaxID=223392 RepID=A0A379M2N7_9NOCA|nr:hypothetical protein [Rhodococcus gordoniae]SUE16614.1 Uncharacterised protein [Rhodococcus gordoniae]